MKKLIAALSAMSMLLTMPVLAADNPTLELPVRRNEPGCYSVEVDPPVSDSVPYSEVKSDDAAPHAVHDECRSVIVSVTPAEDELPDAVSLQDVGMERGTSKPKNFWNIAKKGIYNGAFSGVAGTIYTEYYFDWDETNYCYYTRVRVANDGYTDKRSFCVKNYCTKCGEVSSTEDYEVPAGGGYTRYIMVKHSFTSKHDGHFMYPAVECTSSYGKIKGTIDVNYSNRWS